MYAIVYHLNRRPSSPLFHCLVRCLPGCRTGSPGDLGEDRGGERPAGGALPGLRLPQDPGG